LKRGLIGFITGLLTGMMIVQGTIVLSGRQAAPGGEVLIIPMIIMLIWFGWDMGRQYGSDKAYKAGKDKGFNEGFEEGFYEGQNTKGARILPTGRNGGI
jgi:high-affinity Fe2+/Pb2+ permease